jgi:hypothetical protein
MYVDGHIFQNVLSHFHPSDGITRTICSSRITTKFKRYTQSDVLIVYLLLSLYWFYIDKNETLPIITIKGIHHPHQLIMMQQFNRKCPEMSNMLMIPSNIPKWVGMDSRWRLPNIRRRKGKWSNWTTPSKCRDPSKRNTLPFRRCNVSMSIRRRCKWPWPTQRCPVP